ncbi:lipopolysaccharide biosynthesis protein [Flaviaesturariibacter terrae]
MSTIRKQSLISSGIVYAGFALGFFNTYLFTREGGFTKEQYGVTQTFMAFAAVLYSLASFGSSAYLGKFFPYYEAHLDRKKNDQFTWALLVPVVGFALVTLVGLLFKGTMVNQMFNNSPELLRYYYWLYPFAFGFTMYLVLESYAWMLGRSVLSNLFKEFIFRLLFTTLIVLTYLRVIRNFDTFIHLYAFLYLILAGLLLFLFYKQGRLHFTLRPSSVTRRFRKKILTLSTFFWGSGILSNVAQQCDKILIAAILPNGMAMAGIYSLGEILSSLIQAPQRAVVSASVSVLSHAWREKDTDRVQRIYHRSALNQLIFSVAMFCIVWLNFRDALETFHIQKDFSAAFIVFFFLGITRIIDMGSGVSAQVILASPWWRFEFTSGVLLLLLSLGVNYLLTSRYGILGPALSNLIAYTAYNTIRFVFLWRKFGMQPFSRSSLYTLVLAAAAFLLAWLPCKGHTGFLWLALRPLLFCALFVPGAIALKLSPDIVPIWETVRKRIGLGGESSKSS